MELVIERSIELKAAPSRVWRAITDPKELSRWFPDEAEWTAEAGGQGRFTWHNHASAEVRVIEVAEPHRIVWRWTSNDGRAFDDYSTLVEWTLSERQGGGTILHVRESGFDTQKHLEENTGGWTSELADLETYLAETPAHAG